MFNDPWALDLMIPLVLLDRLGVPLSIIAEVSGLSKCQVEYRLRLQTEQIVDELIAEFGVEAIERRFLTEELMAAVACAREGKLEPRQIGIAPTFHLPARLTEQQVAPIVRDVRPTKREMERAALIALRELGIC
jgi:hypothetical protein